MLVWYNDCAKHDWSTQQLEGYHDYSKSLHASLSSKVSTRHKNPVAWNSRGGVCWSTHESARTPDQETQLFANLISWNVKGLWPEYTALLLDICRICILLFCVVEYQRDWAKIEKSSRECPRTFASGESRTCVTLSSCLRAIQSHVILANIRCHLLIHAMCWIYYSGIQV